MAGYPQWEDRRVREAFQIVLERVDECRARFLPNVGRDGADRFVAPTLGLAKLWKRWQRSAGTWEPASREPHDQFRELTRHLLAEYPVPRFMDSLFLEPGWEHCQAWFPHVGAGRNIRTAPGMTASLTSRMAHHLMGAPASYNVLQAVRYGQVIGLGGKAALAKAIIASRYGRALGTGPDEEFILTVIQWLVNHPELPRTQVGPLIDFIAHRRQVDPEFSMKGRSSAAVLRLMREWHAELRKAPGVGYRALPASGVAESCWELVDERGRVWSVEEVLDTFTLHAEGSAMHHCVFSYVYTVLNRQSSIWSVKVRAGGEPERAVTVEVRNAERRVVQARGRMNRHPTNDEREILDCWAREHGLRWGA